MKKFIKSINWIITTSIISSIAALITAIVTYLMVDEMRIQREINSKPILKISSSLFSLKVKENNFNFRNWINSYSPVSNLYLINYGNGPALDSKIEFVLSTTNIVKLFKKDYPTDLLYFDNTTIDFKEGGIKLFDANYAYKTILPNDFKNRYNIYIPPYYLISLKKYLSLKYLNLHKPKNTNFIKINNFPSINFKLKYRNITDDSFEKHYTLSTKCNILYFIEDDLIQCSFKINPLNK